MQKNILKILVLVLFIGIGLYFAVTRYFHINESAIQTLIQPPSQNIVKLLNENPTTSGPFTVYGDYKVGIFADLAGKSPRVLAFASDNTIFVSIPAKGEILELTDQDQNGKADGIKTVLSGLNRPHGIFFYKGFLYVAETDKVARYRYDGNKFEDRQILFNLPGGGRHFTRTIKVHEDKLYTSVGSSCDVCIEKEDYRASILVSDLDGKNLEVFAEGLRNTVFFDFDSDGHMWGSDMGRDFLGDNLPPDELNIIQKGKNYGWPWCYGDRVRDQKFNSGSDFDCQLTEGSNYNYPSHAAPLGTTFIKSGAMPSDYDSDLLVSFHGSWNSSAKVGYKIVRINIKNGKIIGMKDFLTGFLDDDKVLGRPVDIAFDQSGKIYISDDKANVIYIVTKK